MPSQEEFDTLNDILFNPKDYRNAFRENAESGEEPEIFEILKMDIVKYALENESFKEYLRTSLGFPQEKSPEISKRSSSPIKSVTRFSPRIRSSKVTSLRGSSRPTLD